MAFRDRWRVRRPLLGVYPTRRLAALVLAAGLSWFIPGEAGTIVVAIALGVLLAATIVEYVRLPGRAGVSVERDAPESTGLGDRETLRYRITSEWRWPVAVRLHDALPAGVAHEPLRDGFELAPHETVTIDVPVVAEMRGRFALGPVALELEPRFRLLKRFTRFELDDALVVIPSLANVRRFRLLAMQHRLSDAGVRALRQRGEGTAFAGLRDYVPGDDPRTVDWKSTARHGRPIVREQSVERSQTVLLMLDCGRAMIQLAGRYSRFEHVLSAALVLTDVAATGGDRVGLIAFDDQIRASVAPQRSAGALRVIRPALSALDASMTEPDYAAAFRQLATRQRRRALVVLFTDVTDASTSRSFVAHATRAAQRHAFVVVAIQNEALFDAAHPRASVGGLGRGASSLALYRSAAAEELIREREEALARLRRGGIAVLDVPPTRLAAAVVNRYLEIKARGLL